MTPAPVTEFIRAANAHDLEALSATFADDALVNDIRREFPGRPAIHAWLAREIVTDNVTFDVAAVRHHYNTTILATAITGDYDKTSLPDPLPITLYFTATATHITQLLIIATQPTPEWAAATPH